MNFRSAIILMLALWLVMGGATSVDAAIGGERGSGGTITDRSIRWPTVEEWQRVLTLRDYNTRVVLTGTGLLGFAAGVLGCFTLLRKRALVGDALSHATLPGIGLAFMISVLAGGTGKSLPLLLLGATASGLLGLVMILAIRNLTRLKEDAALGIVLSVFFGAGVSVLGIVQRMGKGHAAGLESFIYGKTASMLASDAQLIAAIAALVLVACLAMFKEFRLVCFDAGYAKSQGWPTLMLDSAMMCLVIIITVIGLQAVGLVLVIALLIVPAAAARFWTERLLVMLVIAGFIGAASGLAGSALSALLPNMPSGAMIVLVATLLFLFSMFFGSARGVLVRWLHRQAFEGKVRRQHLLRAAYELMEGDEIASEFDAQRIGRRVKFSDLLAMRSWSPRRLRREMARAVRAGLIVDSHTPGNEIELTSEGFREAAQLVRQHRLWELYLITHADIAPSHVDRDADAIEHVLDPAMIRELETLLAVERPRIVVPRSPHLIAAPAATPSPGH